MDTKQIELLDYFFNGEHRIEFPHEFLAKNFISLGNLIELPENQKYLLIENLEKNRINKHFWQLSVDLLKKYKEEEKNFRIKAYYEKLLNLISKEDENRIVKPEKEEKEVIELILDYQVDDFGCIPIKLGNLVNIWVLFSEYVSDYDNALKLTKAYDDIICLA